MSSAADHKFMRLALEDCRQAFVRNEGGPFGACIVRDGEVLAVAHNTVLKERDPTAHADMNAIRATSLTLGSHDLSGCVIYATSEPCPMCFAAIHWARMGQIFAGTRIEDVKALGFNELPIDNLLLRELAGLSISLEADILRAECRQLLEDWKAQTLAEVY